MYLCGRVWNSQTKAEAAVGENQDEDKEEDAEKEILR